MFVEGLQYKHTLGQNRWQCNDHHVATVAGAKQLSRHLGLPFIVLDQIANDQIGVDNPSFAHHPPSPSRAAFAVASRISAKDIPLPFLLASTPLRDRVPRCTRMVA